MTNLGDLYNDFFRIDLDAKGGFTRVADVVARQEDGTIIHRAFKLMRHNLGGKQVKIGIERFETEMRILVEIAKDPKAPSAITRIYDSGFVESELSKKLEVLRERDEKLTPTPSLEIISTGMDVQKFIDMKSVLMEKEPNRWLPYLVVELAPYDDSLYRQIKAESTVDLLPVTTIVEMALQILEVLDYLHTKLRYAYMDWKPEHIYWNGLSKQLKLIDWNVEFQLKGDLKETQMIRDDIRLFCGAALYCGLAKNDPDDSDKPVGEKPKTSKNLTPTIHRRYWTDNPVYYGRDNILDEKIKLLVQQSLDPDQGFNSARELSNALTLYVVQSNKGNKSNRRFLSDLYNDFFRIDLDAPGGYARVADVISRQEDGTLIHRAFKLMRHELDGKKVEERFENELKILVEITKDKNAPSAITRIYDSGFVEAKLSESLHTLRHPHTKLIANTDFEIVSTGVNVQRFLETKSDLMAKEPDRWVPYLVVDLAPYGDSLLRQIKAHSLGKVINLYGLPPNMIVEMGIQILYVMEYLHKKLRYAYIDWKPEHIYWNEESQRLKLIDWNVTTRLDGSLSEKQIIREDIRMFCGAALYCSLALTDPEELKKPIGTTLTIPADKTPTIIPRYWTDKPNFYQRDSILDDEIKQLVQKALDPSQGFNSPQELRKVLAQYAQQHNPKGGGTEAPFDAVQHFRRARSYIAASDFVYAIIWLELAIETAKASGETYPDAERLLKNVQDLLKLGEFKQEVKPVLAKEEWRDALGLYAKAVALDPTNAPLKKEFSKLQDLLDTEAKLRRKNISKIFMSTEQLQAILDSGVDVVGSGNPLVIYIAEQIKKTRKQIRLIRIGLIGALVGSLIFYLILRL
ncbi:MAG: hypothetical protein AABZ00_12410 [Chloroflexota bacterium]